MNPTVVYLDTNHISDLARHPDRGDSKSFLRALESASSSLALSIVHLIELSDPEFKSAPDVGAMLDSVPVVWALAPDDLWLAEVNAAFGLSIGVTIPVEPFVRDVNAMLGGRALGAAPSDALIAFSNPDLRQQIEVIAERGMMFEMLKRNASLVVDPLLLLKKMIATRQPRATPSGIILPKRIDADIIVKSAGGLSGFPSYGLMHKVATGRLRDLQFVPQRSDVFDLMHVGYAAYATVTGLERSHAARVRAARPSPAQSVFHRMSEVTAGLLQTAV